MMKRDPDALAELKNSLWVVPDCPICGKRHVHGAGGGAPDPREYLGHRVAHCLPRDKKIQADGYFLVEALPPAHEVGEGRAEDKRSTPKPRRCEILDTIQNYLSDEEGAGLD